MFLIKIGGSVITEKTQEKPIFKKAVMDNLSLMIQKAEKDVVIIHGAGSFGHVLAKRYDLNNGCSSSVQKQGFSETHSLVQKLNSFVIQSLQDHQLAAVSIPPHATIIFNNHEIEWIDTNMFLSYKKQGFVPVSFGDVVLDTSLGCSICSGDLLILTLARIFKPEAVIFVMDEDGLYTANPKIDRNATFIESIGIHDFHRLTTQLDTHADVTKGMEGKLHIIKQIVEQGSNTILLNGNKPHRLYDVLRDIPTKSTIFRR
ncbi:MAG: isopentenyl phosphate kinase [Thermoplasmatota archaeon]